MVRRNDSPSDDSPTSYVGAGDIPTTAEAGVEQPTSHVSVDALPTSVVRLDDLPTSVLPTVSPPPPPPKRRSTLAIVATWSGFALVAVLVVAATSRVGRVPERPG